VTPTISPPGCISSLVTLTARACPYSFSRWCGPFPLFLAFLNWCGFFCFAAYLISPQRRSCFFVFWLSTNGSEVVFLTPLVRTGTFEVFCLLCLMLLLLSLTITGILDNSLQTILYPPPFFRRFVKGAGHFLCPPSLIMPPLLCVLPLL